MNTTIQFDLQKLYNELTTLAPDATGYCIGLSGGVDSVGLLVAIAELRPLFKKPVRAIHIHHGLQAEADTWETFCTALCRQYNLPLRVIRVAVKAEQRESPEAAARRARYDAIAAELRTDEALLTAHHRNDQVETLLLHLIKGGGVDGLAAMPKIRSFAHGCLLRPLLDVSREAIESFLTSRNQPWIEDPSNLDTAFDRNYLRRIVLPTIEARWPSATQCIARSARLLAEQRSFNLDVVKSGWQQCYQFESGGLELQQLKLLTPFKRYQLLREWLRFRSPHMLFSRARLQTLDEQIIDSGNGHRVYMEVKQQFVQSYKGLLLKMHHQKKCLMISEAWKLTEVLFIPEMSLYLEPSQILNTATWLSKQNALTVKSRQGGEVVYIPGRGHRKLKLLLQEWKVPQWQRAELPVIWFNDSVICIPGYWISEQRPA